MENQRGCQVAETFKGGTAWSGRLLWEEGELEVGTDTGPVGLGGEVLVLFDGWRGPCTPAPLPLVWGLVSIIALPGGSRHPLDSLVFIVLNGLCWF